MTDRRFAAPRTEEEAALDKYAAIPTSEAGPDVADAMMGELRDALSEYGKTFRDEIYEKPNLTEKENEK